MEQSLILKCAGVLIQDRRVLVVKTVSGWIAPGGKIEIGENDGACLIRELGEELGIKVIPANLNLMHTYKAEAHGKAGVQVEMRVYQVESWGGRIQPRGEVMEERFIAAAEARHLPLGSIMKTKVIPKLVRAGLID
jgi:8-oxo-dGTP diphosphatase